MQKSSALEYVSVAVGVVVENVSTIALNQPPRFELSDLDATPSDKICVLISLRKSETVLGGFWELPGGKIEHEESAEACVRREFFEEVGIIAEPMVCLPAIEHRYEHAHVRLLPFLCRRVRGLARPIEVQEVKWSPISGLVGYTFSPANEPLLAMVRRCLGAEASGSVEQLLALPGVERCG